MKILLTGASGFIGSHVARILVNTDSQVYAIVPQNEDLWRIRDIVPRLLLMEADLRDHDRIKAQIEEIRPDMCLHLAWYVVPGRYLTAYENMDMLSDSLHLASQLAQSGCKRFVGTGTCFEYDIGSAPLSETSPTKPGTVYAATKLALYTVLERLGDLTGMGIAWLRLFYLYGPYEREQRLVPSVINTLLRNQTARVTKGEQIRDFLHVEDLASAFCAVAQSELTDIVNIGSGNPVKVKDIVLKIGEIIGNPELIDYGALPDSPADPIFVCADNRRLIESTDWVPKYDLETGLRQTIEWWRAHLWLKEGSFTEN